ncbi:hypothetical protein Kfla_6427 [Kribbella flavida DSM 17836]|uniref:Uncharacterized protein n=1 Tax=Kribbella flavida (strain DSM 17836 / JCM 10339 / NBRC 14399) TaxID=479435 RepID=D2PX44_KRIFD|nr:hypothetical protein [Kribbella flavida]ADB35424.1 hypothetical protein Kfla_6427 [Kribbella flavida DSM 17836]
MSSLLRPVGHLPASVYWFRRGLLLVVLVVLLVLLGRLFGGGGDEAKNTAANGPQPGGTAGAVADPVSTPSSGGTETPARTSQTPDGTGTPSDRESTPETPEPPKDCSGRDVRVSVLPAVRSISAGGTLNFAVRLTAVRSGCKAAIDPTLLSVTITSGSDQIWTTTQCEQSVPRATVLIAKGKQATSVVGWNGRRSGPGCLPGQPQAKPGTYVAKAVYDGQASAAQAFNIV